MSQRFKTRRGYTLLEVMVTVTLSSLLLVTGVMLYSALLNSQRQFSLRQRQRREVSRIEAILRSDTHAASAVEAKNAESCELKNAAGDTWTYRRDDDSLLRVRAKAGAVVQRESFRLQPGTKLEFRVNREAQRLWLAVSLEPPPSAGPKVAPASSWQGKFLIGGLVAERGEEAP